MQRANQPVTIKQWMSLSSKPPNQDQASITKTQQGSRRGSMLSDLSYSWSHKLFHINDNPTTQGPPNSDSGVRTLGINQTLSTYQILISVTSSSQCFPNIHLKSSCTTESPLEHFGVSQTPPRDSDPGGLAWDPGVEIRSSSLGDSDFHEGFGVSGYDTTNIEKYFLNFAI